jgi:hypothetical protein
MKPLFLTLAFSTLCLAQVPPHQCIAFIINQSHPALSSMPVSPVFLSRVWVACLPKEGVKSYQIDINSASPIVSPITQRIDLQAIPGPQVSGAEWQEVLFMAIPPTFGAIANVTVYEIQISNPRPATLVQ